MGKTWILAEVVINRWNSLKYFDVLECTLTEALAFLIFMKASHWNHFYFYRFSFRIEVVILKIATLLKNKDICPLMREGAGVVKKSV